MLQLHYCILAVHVSLLAGIFPFYLFLSFIVAHNKVGILRFYSLNALQFKFITFDLSALYCVLFNLEVLCKN